MSFALCCVDTKFKQQQLPAWQPILTANTVLPLMFAIGVGFIPLGVAFLISANNVCIGSTCLYHLPFHSLRSKNNGIEQHIFQTLIKRMLCENYLFLLAEHCNDSVGRRLVATFNQMLTSE